MRYRFVVEEARALGLKVIDRCNLTVLLEPGQEDLVTFLAAHQARLCFLSTHKDLKIHDVQLKRH